MLFGMVDLVPSCRSFGVCSYFPRSLILDAKVPRLGWFAGSAIYIQTLIRLPVTC